MSNNNNASILESTLNGAMHGNFSEVVPTEKEFNDFADKVRAGMQTIAPVSDEVYENILRKIKKNFSIIYDEGTLLSNPSNNHKPWLASRKAEIDPFFWNRYKNYLITKKNWNPRVAAKLGQISDDILDQCGDPKEKNFKIRGLMMGDVQSGKTANYTAIINKAADAGYRLIIVLAGIPEVLRQQTQRRLDYEFIGRSSNHLLDPKSSTAAKNHPVGVGEFGNDKRINSFTSEANDFDSKVLQSNNLGLDTVTSPVLLVVKKNKTILRNLFSWLKFNNLQYGEGQIDLPLLFIDDEADNASINTNKEETDPTAINQAIRDILGLFTKSSYLAVTATPFANIFIDPDETRDLFPSDFIYELNAPSNYIGADQMFGDNDNGDNEGFIEIIDENEFYRVFPKKHNKTLVVEDLPKDLYKAVSYFLLVNAIRCYRGDGKEHSSMMVHVSRFINVQNQIADILYEWLEQVKSDVFNYSHLDTEMTDEIESIHNLKCIWKEYKLENKAGTNWENVLCNYLYDAISPIYVRAVNGKSSSALLDYAEHKEDGLKIIAVGGNTLSRGLTLEGLSVSYFFRTTNMYDTLMQMGRWFGYRNNYDDLVKVWLSEDEVNYYGQITEAMHDLRSQFERMHEAHLKPENFGLRVRQDPGALIVTARNKMRTSTQVKCPVSVSGHLIETPRLVASKEVLKKNEDLVRAFVNKLSSTGHRVPNSDERTRDNYFWEHVPGELVSNLISEFKTNPWHLAYNSKGLANYIKENENGNVWDVVLICHGEGRKYPKGFPYGNDLLKLNQTEIRTIEEKDGMLKVSSRLRVGAGGCTRIGISKSQEMRIRRKAIRGGKKNVSDSDFLIHDRPPILMLHVIDAKYKTENTDYPEFLFALGIGFPSDIYGTKTATYVVNKVDLPNWSDDDGADE